MKSSEWDSFWKEDNKLINFGRRIYNAYFKRVVLRYAGKEDIVAELGCGGATLARSICPKIKSYTGIDNSGSALDLALKNIKGINNAMLMRGDLLNFKNDTRQFDIVWSNGLLEHFNPSEPCLDAHWNLARKYAIICVPWKYSYHYLWSKLGRLWPWEKDLKFFTNKELLALAKTRTDNARCLSLFNPVRWILGNIIVVMKK